MKIRILLMIASVFTLLLSSYVAVFAADPVQCTYQSFTWQCTDGSEKFANDPTPPLSGLGGNGYFESQFFSDTGFGGNAYVQTGPGFAIRFKTTQKYLAWWDASNTLHVVEQMNGVITIPSNAVMIGIPADVLGDFDLPGWIKGQLVETGEYVLASTHWIKR